MEEAKQNKFLFILIVILTLTELYWGYKVYRSYKGVYDIGFFLIFVLQPLWYSFLIVDVRDDHPRWKIIISIILTIILPIILYYSLPNYSYDDGREIIREKFDEDVEFTDYSNSMDTIPVFEKEKNIFINDRTYYYKIYTNGKYKYFILNEKTGKLIELEEGYWE
ncbi:hypothetical protein [Senegalia sp. (in: firmicutes)]|uniref:hypothetical protein n=1 Tax=Senegalia sp. (in: firmicutes) TaxID=1924098 RepID=UPI003F977E54